LAFVFSDSDCQLPAADFFHPSLKPFLVTASTNLRTERSYVRSASGGNKQPGNSFMRLWKEMHSQHIPFFSQELYVHPHDVLFLSFLQSMAASPQWRLHLN
jgi:hypothetical protein